MARPKTEAELAAMWLAHATRAGPMRDSRGRRVEVIYPGRLVGVAGPDLVDALFCIEHGPVQRGAIELHLDEAGWTRHGHQRDPAYRDVRLHVVWTPLPEPQPEYPPCLSVAPWFGALPVPPGAAGRAQDHAYCVAGKLPGGPWQAALLDTVVHQGLLRHAERIDAMEGDMQALGHEQALYVAVLRALGYRANTSGFEALAVNVPLQLLEQIAGASPMDRAHRAEAALLGTAGLLPSQRGLRVQDVYVAGLESRWVAFAGLSGMGQALWRFQGVRPANWPPRRIAAAARIFTRVHGTERTLVETLLTEVVQAADTGEHAALAAWFLVSADSDAFWAKHYDFGRPSRRPATSLIGRTRAVEILVNAVLPFATAVARLRGHAELARASAAILSELNAGGWNQFTRYMAGTLNTGRRGLGSAAAQQGLLRLYHRWCRDKRCDACPAAAVAHQALNAVTMR